MIIAQCGDLHITDRRDDSRATLEEQVELLKWIGEDAAKAGARAMLCGGDVYDSASTPAERRAAVEVFTAWAERMPVIVVRGNHDRPLDLHVLGRIRSRHQIRVLEQPEIVDVAGVTVACLPWPRKASLVAAMPDASGVEVNSVAGEALRMILQGFRVERARTKGAMVILGHVELGGARLDNGQPIAGRCDVALHDGDLLDVGADAVMLSHIHLHQILGDGRIVYAGAPRPTRFGEEAPKGYCLVDVERGEAPVIEHRRAPYRELVTFSVGPWSADMAAAVAVRCIEDAGQGSAIRVQYEVDESQRRQDAEWADDLRACLLKRGAHSVKLDPRVTTTHRVRSEEIRTARTVAERIRAYWSARGGEPARAEHIRSKLSTLEAA